jgi:putative glutamine amidotransferase
MTVTNPARAYLGVQWHAEHDPQTNPFNRILFEAFGAALVSYKRTS